MATMADLPKEQIVTASDLVRHFGEWQERAARAPVYIMHRGRPRLVMTSVALMDGLCEPHGRDDGLLAQGALDALLDASREIIVLLGPDMEIAGLSRSARAHFGSIAQSRMPMSMLIRSVGGQFAYDTAVRTLESGIPETIEITSAHRPGRRLSIATEPHPAGVVMLIKDVTEQHQASDAKAQTKAMLQAIGETGISAIARINQRGHLCDADPSLAAMTGLPQAALTDLRFANLIEIGSRVAVTEAVEKLWSTGQSPAIDATLLVARADPLPVRIGLGALYDGARLAAVLAMIVKRAD